MMILRLSVFLLFICSYSAFAGELDSYYLQQFGEQTSDSSKKALKSTAAVTVHKCGMPLRHDLKRDWKQLETTTRKTLAKYLEKPTWSDEVVVQSSGGHFTIHYTNSAPDAPAYTGWIQTVGDVFEAVYTKETTQMGFTVPPGAPYHIYLQNMTYFGLTETNPLPIGSRSATSYMTIENDFAEHPFQASIPGNDSAYNKSLKALQITAAHEFHHVIQFGYNYYFEPWYAEATSSWVEDEVYNSVNQIYNYLGSYLADTTISLNNSSGYDRWIFNRFLYEQFQPQNMILKIWDEFALEQPPPSGADIPMLPFIDRILKTQGGSLPASFSGFAKRIYMRNWSSHTDEITYIPGYTPVTTYSTYPVNSSSLPTPTVTLPAYSFGYYNFSPGSSAPINLKITFSPSENFSITAFKKTTGGIVTEYPLTTVGGTLTIDSFNVVGVSELALLICNTSPATATVSFSTDGTIPVSAATSSGSSGGCFIATAAYGSYLHPEVMTLRDFRDRYLLTNMPGRAFVALYYRLSPPIADFISEHESARFMIRILLVPIIFAVKHLSAVLATAVILLLMACRRVWKRSAIKTAAVTENR